MSAEHKYASRGALKLLGIADRLDFLGKTVADIGSSNGGFTEVALALGAKKVFAIDVGYGLLEWKLRNDPRVVVMERTNARGLLSLPLPIDVFLVDVSFISLKLILPSIRKIIDNQRSEGDDRNVDIAALIKPQFEATKIEASRAKGVITDSQIKSRVVEEIKASAQRLGFVVAAVVPSPILGAKGNEEFFLILSS